MDGKITSISDIVEENGRTVRENNLDRPHNIPVGTFVQVTFRKWLGEGACSRTEARLWVISHDRDCDGSPLYSVAEKPIEKLELIVRDVCEEITGEPFPIRGEEIRGRDGRILHGDRRFWEILRSLDVVRETGFDERSLTVIEMTDDLKHGVGVLKWDEE